MGEETLVPKLRFVEFDDEWKNVILSDISKIRDGTHASHKTVDDGVYLLSSKDVVNGKIIISDDALQISHEDYDKLHKKFKIENGDVLLTIIGSTCRSAVIKDYNNDYTFRSSVAIIKTSENPYFLENYFKTPIFIHDFNKRLNVTAYESISLGDLSKINVKLPTISEQQKIVSFISNIDKKIDLLERKHQKYQDFKKYLMQQIFVQKLRFNENCDEIKLKNIVDYQNSKALEKYFNDSEGYKVISIGNYSTDGQYLDNNVFISKNISEVQKYVLNKNDLAMVLNDKTKEGNIIGRCILIDENDKYVYNQRTARLTPKIDINPYYLHQLINSPIIHKRIFALSQGATQIYINKGDLLNIMLPIPDINIQNEISNLFENVNKKIELSSFKLNQINLFKKGLLQQMFV